MSTTTPVSTSSQQSAHPQLLWQPSPERIAKTHLTRFKIYWSEQLKTELPDYAAVYARSIQQPDLFWNAIWDFCGVIGERGDEVLTGGDTMLGTRWFPHARLNFAQNLLQESKNSEALVFWGEDKIKRCLSRQELYHQVAQLAQALRSQGIMAGDRIAAYMPNMPETIVMMLAAASLGAVFTSASPDFGVQGVLDRFGQTTPKILLACDGYWYNGKQNNVLAKLSEIVPQLPSVERVVVVPYLDKAREELEAIPNAISYEDFIAPYSNATEIEYAQLPFDHPLYIMYSSGTTGVPKCIVHGAGGTLLQHLKEHQLHSDVHVGDRLFYFTTCGWMMWNWLVSGLASGATLLLYDGNPFVDHARILWRLAQEERMTHFGTSAKYIDALAKSDLRPAQEYDLKALRAMMSTGSPLSPEGFDFVYREIKSDLQLSSISGGTDIVSCFALGNPTGAVWRGELQCRGLGMAVEVWNEQGQPVHEEKGELVCVKPFPCMPIGFWNDPDKKKYHAAYFERFPKVWCHGDFCELTAHDGVIIYGRSDATLNPGGVRIGTAEIYRQVEKLPEILESVVIGQDWRNDVRVVLFVKLREGVQLDDALRDQIKSTIRKNTTPRHVPAVILQVADIPRTKSGKIVELAVRNIVQGEPIKNKEALANPEALQYFAERPELSEPVPKI